MTLHPVGVFEVDESLAAQPGLEGKGFGPRFFAYLIDTLCIWLISLAVGYVFRYIMGFVVNMLVGLLSKSYFYDAQLQLGIVDTLVGVTVSISYFVLFESLYGASPGKVLLAMQVVTTGGDNISINQAFVRGVFRLFDGLFFAIPAITRMREPLHQRHGDAQADTMVIARSSLTEQNRRPIVNFLTALVLFGLIAFLGYMIDLVIRSSFV